MTALDTGLDLELEYDNRRRHPEHEQIAARWTAAAADYRAEADAQLDIPYGPAKRHRFDLFAPAGGAEAAPLVAYFHGGYWKSRDRKDFSHVARPLNARGLAVAIPSYSLCPDVAVAEIVEEMRAFLHVLWRRLQRRPAVAGHSAGGHLAACMVATDWAALDGVPGDLVTAGYAISGLFDLTPLCATSINDDLHLTPEQAEAASPLGWSFPPEGRRLIAAAGGEETGEFQRQSRIVVEEWGRRGVRTEFVLVESTNHFTILDALMAPDGGMVDAVTEMARAASEARVSPAPVAP